MIPENALIKRPEIMAFYKFSPIFFQFQTHLLKTVFIYDQGGIGRAFSLQGLFPILEITCLKGFEHSLSETLRFGLKKSRPLGIRERKGGNPLRDLLFFCRSVDTACGRNDKQGCEKEHSSFVHLLSLSLEHNSL